MCAIGRETIATREVQTQFFAMVVTLRVVRRCVLERVAATVVYGNEHEAGIAA